jgi:aspartate-semialdehyde dehydrogenase
MLLRVLEERAFPLRELRPLASARSAGRGLQFRGAEVKILEATAANLAGVDLVFFAAESVLSRELAPAAAAAGAVVIDKSGTWRLDPTVPLVVPEVNAAALTGHRGIIAGPNCTTVAFVQALEPLRRAAGLKHVMVVTLQSASGAGRAGLDALEGADNAAFPRSLPGNVIPQCETFRDDGYTTEEVKLQDEARKILGLPDLQVTMTCVRVPVAVGHAAAILVETERDLSPAAAEEALRAQPGVIVHSGTDYPTPIEIAGRDEVFIGRIRRDPTHPRRLWLWQASDNLRKGAATNAVQIAEALLPI